MHLEVNMVLPSNTDLKSLKCSLCNNYLSCGPVYIRSRQSICGRCPVVEENEIRNYSYEVTAAQLRFPCSYRKYGCKETQMFAEIFEYSHEYSCEFRTYNCMFADENDKKCVWKSLKRKLISHCKAAHPSKLLCNCSNMQINIRYPNSKNYLIIAFQMAFVFNVQVFPKKTYSKMVFQLAFLGKQEAAKRFHYTVNIYKDKSFVTKRSLLINLMEIQLDTLEDVFNGTSGVRFHLTISVFCKNCKKEFILGKMYNQGTYWLCSDCTPILRTCRNKKRGCKHKDIPIKISKHEQYFCTKHKDHIKKCNSSLFGADFLEYGRIWQIKDCYVKSTITTDIGLVVCEFTSVKTEGKFELFIYSTLRNGQEDDFTCTVYFANSYCGETIKFSPTFECNQEYDWYIGMDQMKYPSWGSDLSIYLIIQRNPFLPPEEIYI